MHSELYDGTTAAFTGTSYTLVSADKGAAAHTCGTDALLRIDEFNSPMGKYFVAVDGCATCGTPASGAVIVQ